MKMPSVCSQCGGYAPEPNTCRLCGAIVCSRCFEEDSGICRRCSSLNGTN